MFRMLFFMLLIGLALAEYNRNYNRRYHRPQYKKSHHMVALDQLIKKKPAVHFLGRGFVNRALRAQGENKFLQLRGKEQRDVNGTIQINKQNVYIDVSEAKDGHFLVQNQKKKVVGRVDMHAGSTKHMTVHRTKNGEQYINGYQVGNAAVTVEQDMAVRYGRRYRGRKMPKQHMHMSVVQNHDTQGNIYITNDKPSALPTTAHQQYRYRRQAVNNVDCRELNCLYTNQNL